jgi:hypothetical protein
MAYPPLNGVLVSSSGIALEERASALAAANMTSGGGAMGGIGNLGIGLIIALAVLAYWYTRVL